MKKLLLILVLVALQGGCIAMQELTLTNKTSKTIGVELKIEADETQRRFSLVPDATKTCFASDLKNSAVRIFVVLAHQIGADCSMWLKNPLASGFLLMASENLEIQENDAMVQILRVRETV